MAAWRVAESLLKLREQLDELSPKRSTASDGTIGDAAHQSRTSDHNPWITDPPGPNVVSARDVTHDPEHGIDCEWVAEMARTDPRCKYVIWNRRIADGAGQTKGGGAWRPYSGTANPHTAHCHISVMSSKNVYDDRSPWALPGETPPNEIEDEMTEEDRKLLRWIKDRLAAITPDGEFYVVEDGRLKLVERGTPGAKPVALMDDASGNAIMRRLGDIEAKIDAQSGSPA